ncbi:hypothetical protein [Desulfurobacterium sp.]
MKGDIRNLLSQGLSEREVEKILMEKYGKELSFTSVSWFTYLFLLGFPVLLVSAVLLKVGNLKGAAYYVDRLVLLLGAMATLKGFVGHFVSVFLRREKFKEELGKMKYLMEEKDGESTG